MLCLRRIQFSHVSKTAFSCFQFKYNSIFFWYIPLDDLERVQLREQRLLWAYLELYQAFDSSPMILVLRSKRKKKGMKIFENIMALSCVRWIYWYVKYFMRGANIVLLNKTKFRTYIVPVGFLYYYSIYLFFLVWIYCGTSIAYVMEFHRNAQPIRMIDIYIWNYIGGAKKGFAFRKGKANLMRYWFTWFRLEQIYIKGGC